MPLNRQVARLNRRVTNHVMRPIARRVPGFGVVQHTGRRTGRRFATPVNVFQRGSEYLVALTYGVDSDWVKNVLTAGGCELTTRGRLIRLGSPEIFHDERRAAAPVLVRPLLGAIGVADFMRLTPRRGR